MRLRDKLFPKNTFARYFLRKINNILHGNFYVLKEIFKTAPRDGIENLDEAYRIWIKLNEPTGKELEKQSKAVFENMPKISIIVPMYNTSIDFLKELVQSLVEQTYSNWELCLSDGSPKRNNKINKICKTDRRIKYKHTGENLGISGNTNEALKRATGDFIGLLDHDDILAKNALFEVVKTINENKDVEFIYTDEDKFTTIGEPRFEPYFKPDFAIDTLRTNNYICHFSVFKKELMEKLGGFRSEYDGAQDHDIVLRMSELTNKIVHISKVLYHWRCHSESTASAGETKPYTNKAAIKAVEAHLKRVGLTAEVKSSELPEINNIYYKVEGNPKVTILIPNYNQAETLKTCIDSILNLTTYENYEIVIIENNSTEESIFEYYKELEKNSKIRVIYYKEKGFNYSRIINFGVKNSDGDYIVQLNNDTELLTPEWLENMVGFCQRKDVGAVGVKLYYPDNTIQHAGVIVGMGGVAGHVNKNVKKNEHGYFAGEIHIQNLSAVTAACIMTRREIYEEVGYMDEEYAVAFNDIDFCLKIREKGYLIVYNPTIEFMHYESKSRGVEDTPEKKARFEGEINRFKTKWKEFLKTGDPYYNINLSLNSEQVILRTDKIKYK